MAQEQERGITITSAALPASGRMHEQFEARINIIVLGHVDLRLEVERSLRVLDGSLFLRTPGSNRNQKGMRQADRYGVPESYLSIRWIVRGKF